MKNLIKAGFLTLMLTSSAYAVPSLQLDILNGVYVAGSEESVVATSDPFELYAYCNIGAPKHRCGLEHYLSVAIQGEDGPVADGTDFGSFSVNGTVYDLADMIFGIPPIEADGTADHDGGDLGGHGVFETLFLELGFDFMEMQTRSSVNVQDTPGTDPTANPGSDLAWIGWDIDSTGLNDGFFLHFDLYNIKVRNGDYDIKDFAPFSHDARGGDCCEMRVPEPNSLFLLGLGLLLVTTSRRVFAGR